MCDNDRRLRFISIDLPYPKPTPQVVIPVWRLKLEASRVIAPEHCRSLSTASQLSRPQPSTTLRFMLCLPRVSCSLNLLLLTLIHQLTDRINNTTSSPGQMSPRVEEKRASTQGKGQKLYWYPLSSIVLLIWLAYISVLLWLLERSTDETHASYPTSWWYWRLPNTMLTGFAQAHLAITAMHLARLAVSALHHERTSARSWAELFWTADRNWKGPVSLGGMFYDRWLMRGHGMTRFSATFWLFVATCFVVLPTPYLLQRTYDPTTFMLPTNGTRSFASFQTGALTQLSLAEQQSTGEAIWVTDLPLTDMYSTTLFVPRGTPRDNTANDFLIAGNFGDSVVYNASTVQTTATCAPVESAAPFDNLVDFYTWKRWCNETIAGDYRPFALTNQLTFPSQNVLANISSYANYKGGTRDGCARAPPIQRCSWRSELSTEMIPYPGQYSATLLCLLGVQPPMVAIILSLLAPSCKMALEIRPT